MGMQHAMRHGSTLVVLRLVTTHMEKISRWTLMTDIASRVDWVQNRDLVNQEEI